MKVMAIVKGRRTPRRESCQTRSSSPKYNEALVKAGVMLAGDAPEQWGQAPALLEPQDDSHRRSFRTSSPEPVGTWGTGLGRGWFIGDVASGTTCAAALAKAAERKFRLLASLGAYVSRRLPSRGG